MIPVRAAMKAKIPTTSHTHAFSFFFFAISFRNSER